MTSTSGDDLHCLVEQSVRVGPEASGVLDGRTFVVKDLYAIAGHVSSFGMPRWRATHEASTATAPVVGRLLEHGAELVGMAKMDELAYSLVGNAGEGAPPRNSCYPERFTGGSSSGSASAVAGGLADLGVGSDTAGSIRVPAAACGLFSIRPTHGTIATGGMLPLAPSMDVVGFLAREPGLLRDVLTVATDGGRAARPTTTLLMASEALEWIEGDAADALRRAAGELARRVGASLEEVDFSRFTSVEEADRFARLQGREIWSVHSQWVEENLDVFTDDVRTRLLRCRQFSQAPEAERARDDEGRRVYRDDFDARVPTDACVVLPVIPGLPPLVTASAEDLAEFRTQAFRLTALSTLTGAPEVVVPVRHPRSGDTYGLGLVGARGADQSLLRVALEVR